MSMTPLRAEILMHIAQAFMTAFLSNTSLSRLGQKGYQLKDEALINIGTDEVNRNPDMLVETFANRRDLFVDKEDIVLDEAYEAFKDNETLITMFYKSDRMTLKKKYKRIKEKYEKYKSNKRQASEEPSDLLCPSKLIKSADENDTDQSNISF